MTEKYIRDILARVELRNAPLPIELFRVQVSPRDIYISVRARVPDRDTGEPTYVYNHLWQDPGLFQDLVRAEQHLLFMYEQLLKGVYEHEFYEAFHVDGKRVKDPHHAIGDRVEGKLITKIERLDKLGYKKRLTLDDGRVLEVP